MFDENETGKLKGKREDAGRESGGSRIDEYLSQNFICESPIIPAKSQFFLKEKKAS